MRNIMEAVAAATVCIMVVLLAAAGNVAWLVHMANTPEDRSAAEFALYGIASIAIALTGSALVVRWVAGRPPSWSAGARVRQGGAGWTKNVKVQRPILAASVAASIAA